MPELELRPSGGDGVIVAIRGEVDMATVPELRDVLNDLVDRGSAGQALEESFHAVGGSPAT